jgi:hypothetical protein
MVVAQFNSLFGWAAYLSAATTIATTITGILFFTKGGHFGKINDAISVFQMLFMLPLSAGLFLLIRHDNVVLAWLVTAVGVSGMFVAAVLQALLVFDIVKYEQTISMVLAAGGAIGFWLILANVLALNTGALSVGLAPSGILAGAGYILLAIGFNIRGHQHPLSYIGSGLTVITYSIWSIWLGWLFTSGGLANIGFLPIS